MKIKYVLGYDVGGTKIGIGLATTEGKLLAQARLENKDTYPEDVLPKLVAFASELAGRAGIRVADISAFGISSPYPADAFNGIMTAPPNNPKWRNVPILKHLKDNLGIDGCFENDANCGALAEWYFGAARGCEDFIYLTMSTGIGGGIVAGGKLIRGTVLNAGEIGHVVIQLDGRRCGCGQLGCYEAYSGGRALALRMQEELKNQPDHPIVQFAGGKFEDVDMLALEKAVRAGNEYALALWEEMSVRNAQAFGMLINTFNPEKLVLGTLAWAVGDLYTDPIKKHLPRFAWAEPLAKCELAPSALRRDIGYYAGVAAAIYHLNEVK